MVRLEFYGHGNRTSDIIDGILGDVVIQIGNAPLVPEVLPIPEVPLLPSFEHLSDKIETEIKAEYSRIQDG